VCAIGRGTKVFKCGPSAEFFLTPQKKERKRKTKQEKRKEFLVCIRSFEGRRSWGKEKEYWGFFAIRGFSLAWIFFFVLASLLSLSVCLSVWWVISLYYLKLAKKEHNRAKM